MRQMFFGTPFLKSDNDGYKDSLGCDKPVTTLKINEVTKIYFVKEKNIHIILLMGEREI